MHSNVCIYARKRSSSSGVIMVTIWERKAVGPRLTHSLKLPRVFPSQWHYVLWDEGNAGEMLLDHSTDPLELKNLAADPAYAQTITQMKRYLKQLPVSSDE